MAYDKNIWSPNHSKWKAAEKKGINLDLKGTENILYLGASSGSTISHLHKKTKGIIFAVEKSPRMAIDLIKLSKNSKNIAPILEDAHNIEEIKKRLQKKDIDIIFQDIPSLDQIEILEKASTLVNNDCKILLSLKTKSISQKDSESTKKEMETKINKSFKILEKTSLEPYHLGHYFYLLKKL